MLAKICVILVLISGILAQDPLIKNGPIKTIGVDEQDVTLYCQIEENGKSADVFWHCSSASTAYDITIGPNVNTNSALSRYTIDNSGASVGQYNLIIANATFLDSGKCVCILVDDLGNVFEADATLEVSGTPTPPSEPSCSIDKISTPGQSRRVFTAEDDVTLTCESPGGVPLADLHWEIVRAGSDGKGIKIASSYAMTENSIIAIAEYQLTAADDGAYFQCVQTHTSLPDKSRTCSPIYTSVNGREPIGLIMVKYRPILRFVPSRIMVNAMGTTRETLRCEYEANPELDEGPIIGAEGSINLNYTFEGREDSVELILDKNDIGTVLRCNASNELGDSGIELIIEMERESDILLPVWLVVAITGGSGLLLFFICAVCLCLCLKEDDDDLKPGRVRADPFKRDQDRDNNPRVYDYPPDSYGSEPGGNNRDNDYGEREGEGARYMNYEGGHENEMLSLDNIEYFDEKAGYQEDFETGEFDDNDC